MIIFGTEDTEGTEKHFSEREHGILRALARFSAVSVSRKLIAGSQYITQSIRE
jgi:hypothetical protein